MQIALQLVLFSPLIAYLYLANGTEHIKIKTYFVMALQITSQNYKELIESGKPVVIDFWAEWCGPCRMVSPIIDELAQEFDGQVVIGKCDVDNNDEVAAEFRVRNIPTILFFKGGQAVDKQVGATTKEALTAKVKALL